MVEVVCVCVCVGGGGGGGGLGKKPAGLFSPLGETGEETDSNTGVICL